MSRDTTFTVKEDGRLLQCVRDECASLSNSKSKSMLEHGQIFVDGIATTKFDHPVRAGQRVTLKTTAVRTVDSPLPVIYEDDYLLAVDKPAGLLSVASDGEKENTAFRLLKDAGVYPIYVVHRLDKDTSGVLLFAKSPEIRETLQSNWSSVERREYLAVCEGVFRDKNGCCDTILAENAAHRVYSIKSGEGKRAITHYKVINENSRYSMVSVTIDTGRKNQIRAHMSELSHPIAGDRKYGAKTDPMKRLALHASVLSLRHPVSGELLTLKSPTPRGFKLPK